jgi:hypothetical protein
MAKRSIDDSYSERVEPEWLEKEDTFTGVKYERKSASSVTRLVLLRDVIYKCTGKSTGRQYVFNGAGSIQDVDKKDAEFLLSKEGYRSCCDSYSTPYFEIVE